MQRNPQASSKHPSPESEAAEQKALLTVQYSLLKILSKSLAALRHFTPDVCQILLDQVEQEERRRSLKGGVFSISADVLGVRSEAQPVPLETPTSPYICLLSCTEQEGRVQGLALRNRCEGEAWLYVICTALGAGNLAEHTDSLARFVSSVCHSSEEPSSCYPPVGCSPSSEKEGLILDSGSVLLLAFG